MTEIEIRGKFTKKLFDNLFKLLSQKGKLIDHYHRLSIDLSPGFDPITKTWPKSSGTDVRLKKSDHKEKLSIKTGNFHDLVRKEIEVKLQTGQFLHALDFLETLGFSSGMIYCWESWEFDYQKVEFKLSKYTDDYYTFEIEGKHSSDIRSIAKQLNLKPYTQSQYKQAIDWENQNIHQPYDRKIVEKVLTTLF